MSGWEFYFYMLVGPMGMFLTGLIVYYLVMREPTEDKSPAE